MFKKLWSFLGAHKILTTIAILAIAAGGYYVYKNKTAAKTETRYVLTAVAKNTIVTAVTGSGQVSTSDQVDLKPKVSGDILAYNMKAGQAVKAGQVLVFIDAADALKAVRDAQDSLLSAQLSLEKLQQAADPLTLLQAQNSLIAAQESKNKALDDLKNDHEDGFNTVSNVYLKLPDMMSGLDDILYSSSLNSSQSNIDAYADGARRYDDKSAELYYEAAKDDYLAARTAYDAGFDEYKLSSRTSPDDSIEALIDRTATVARDVSEAVKSANNLIQFYQDQLTLHGSKVSSVTTSHISMLDSYTGTVNSQLSGLLSTARAISDGKNAVVSADRTIIERQGSLDKVQAPPDQIDLRSSQLTLRQRQEALDDARSKLADYTVRAPFDGTVAMASNLKRGDAVSSSTALGTVITDQPIAKLSLNEIDVAKVKVGQKTTLTFDVIADLSITGNVVDIDTLGTTSQGVVSYGVKIAFDTSDDRIKPGMTVSASIITDAKTDVLAVPNSAIKSANGTSYVETIDGATAADANNQAGILAPQGTKRVTVVTGLASDTQTEIVSGLKEGDLIVSRTITAAAVGATPATTNRSILQAAGAGGGGVRTGGGGGGFRPGN